MDTCKLDECGKPVHCKGLCPMHYQRQRLTGTTNPRPRLTDSERFWANTRREGNCIVWIGGRHPLGYGYFGAQGIRYRAHRWAWEEAKGPIPDGAVIHHMCSNKPCVNVEHLECTSQAANVAEALEVRKVHKGNLEMLGCASSLYVSTLPELVPTPPREETTYGEAR